MPDFHLGRYVAPDPDSSAPSDASQVQVEAEIKRARWFRHGDKEPPSSEVSRFANGFEMDIGFTQSAATSRYNTFVLTVAGLEKRCVDENISWGRHCLLFGEFRQGRMTDDVLRYASEYCRRHVGAPEEVWAALDELGASESEDIDSGVPGRAQWHIAANLLELASPDAELATYAPATAEGFGLRVRVRIGATGGIEAGQESAVFEFLLCSPDWIAYNRDLDEPLLCSGFAFARRFDLGRLRRQVEETCSELRGYTGAEAIGKMRRYAQLIS